MELSKRAYDCIGDGKYRRKEREKEKQIDKYYVGT